MALSRLLRIMSLLYRLSDYEVEGLEVRLLEQMKRAWTETLREEARRYGYSGPVNPPRREDLAWLRAEARRDAQSIARTWARDVERQLQRLYATNPRGNRHYYAKHMEAWAAAREVWKSRQIAVTTESKARAYARERFAEMNALRGDRYVIDGPPPVCAVCVGYFAAGVVDQAFVDRHPLPAHVGCPHQWRALKTVPAPAPGELWVG